MGKVCVKGCGVPKPSFTRHSTLPEFPGIHQPKSCLNPVLLGFYGGFITNDCLDHWPLVIDRLQVFFPSLKIGDRTENSTRLPYLSPEKPVCRPKATVRTGHRTLDWLKLRKEYVKAVYCHTAYLTFMQSTPCRMPGWMNHKLE